MSRVKMVVSDDNPERAILRAAYWELKNNELSLPMYSVIINAGNYERLPDTERNAIFFAAVYDGGTPNFTVTVDQAESLGQYLLDSAMLLRAAKKDLRANGRRKYYYS